jgi:hypothetical protein
MVKKRILKPQKMYLKVQIHWSGSDRIDIDLRMFKSIALYAVRSLYGEVGISSEIEAVSIELKLLNIREKVMRVLTHATFFCRWR